MAYLDDVQQLYRQQLGREADASGLSYYTNALQNGASVQDIVGMMQASPEAQSRSAAPAVDPRIAVTPGAPAWLQDLERQTGPSMLEAFQRQQQIMAGQPTAPTGGGSGSYGALPPDVQRLMDLEGSGPGGAFWNRPTSPGAGQPFNATGGGGMAGTGGQNPYLGGMADYMQQRSQFALDQALKSIRSNSIMTGGFGGSGQKVAEGVAVGLAQQGLMGEMAGMFGNAYESDQNRGVQRYGIDTNAALGWGGLNNQRYGIDVNRELGWGGLNNQRYGMDLDFYSQQRGQDLQAIGLGAQLTAMGQQAPWQILQGAHSIYGPYAGANSVTNTSRSGGGLPGAIGGFGAGTEIYNDWANPRRGWF